MIGYSLALWIMHSISLGHLPKKPGVGCGVSEHPDFITYKFLHTTFAYVETYTNRIP